VTTPTTDQLEAVRARLLDPAIHLPSGLGADPESACTMAQVNFALTGKLADGPHRCVSEVVRRWVIRIQDALPDDIRNSEGWRHAAVGIAGSAGSEADESARVALLLTWMWERLGDEAVMAAVPTPVRGVWQAMLTEKTPTAAYAVANASAAAYWQRAAAPGMLARLVACRAVSA